MHVNNLSVQTLDPTKQTLDPTKAGANTKIAELQSIAYQLYAVREGNKVLVDCLETLKLNACNSSQDISLVCTKARLKKKLNDLTNNKKTSETSTSSENKQVIKDANVSKSDKKKGTEAKKSSSKTIKAKISDLSQVQDSLIKAPTSAAMANSPVLRKAVTFNPPHDSTIFDATILLVQAQEHMKKSDDFTRQSNFIQAKYEAILAKEKANNATQLITCSKNLNF